MRSEKSDGSRRICRCVGWRGLLSGVRIGGGTGLAALLMFGAGAMLGRAQNAGGSPQAGQRVRTGRINYQGVTAPPGLPDDRDALWIAEEDYIKEALPPGAEKYASVDGIAIKKTEEEIVAISKKSRNDGNQFWGRIAGTAYDHLTSDYMEDRFKKLGLETRRIENDLPPQWFPTSWDVQLIVGGKSVPLKSAFPIGNSIGTTNGVVEAEPVWVGLGTAADFQGRDVKGKAVFIYSWPTDGGVYTSSAWTGALQRALDSGAASVFIVQGFPGNMQSMLFGNHGGQAAMGPLTAVPAMSVSHDEGNAVRQAIEDGASLKVRMRLDVKIVSALKTNIVLGTLPGQSDESIVVLAHHDAYFDGALDNASGMATMLEIARYYAAIPTLQRRRTMVFIDSPTHHSPGVVGGVWMRLNMKDFFSKVVLIANCEHTSQTQIYFVNDGLMTADTVSARRWYASGSDAFKKLVPETFREFGVAVHKLPEATPGGDLSQFYFTAPSFHIIDNILNHTTADTIDWTPASAMATVTRAYLKIFDSANEMTAKEIAGDFHPTFPPPR